MFTWTKWKELKSEEQDPEKEQKVKKNEEEDAEKEKQRDKS